MADAVIARGYLQVVPKMDKGALDSALSDAGKSGSSKFSQSFQGGVSAKAVAIGNVMSTALVKGAEVASQAAAKVVTGAFTNYSTYEQLAGGVEKIFNDMDNSRVFRDASEAWRDLNMSVNDYLATINDVGAMFSATMGDERAYEAARKGMKAISDYSSGTGKNLDVLNEKFAMITRASSSYQSIADQFSGILPATSADFLAQAQAAGYLSEEYTKLTEVPIDEYQSALVEMLEDGTEALGLQGNTAAETANTISGSIAAMQAAWDNWLTGIADENADMGQLTDDLVQSIEMAVENVLPRVQVIAGRVGPAVADALSGIFHSVSPDAGDAFDKAAEGMGKIADGLGGIVEQAAASGLLDSIADGINNIGDAVQDADFGPWFEALANGLDKLNEFGNWLNDTNLDAAMENGGMYAEMFDPSTWHMFDSAAQSFRDDLEALGTTTQEYGRLSDKTMRTVADAYRTNGHDMEAALASAGLAVDSTTGKIEKANSTKLQDQTARISLDEGELVTAQGDVYTWNGTELLDKDGNAAVYDGELLDAQGNLYTWNGTELESKSATVSVTDNASGVLDSIRSKLNNIDGFVATARANIQQVFGNAEGGFARLHATGGFVTDGATVLGTDARGVTHIAGEAGREWVMAHADGTTSIVPVENRKYLKPYAEVIASMMPQRGAVNVVVNLDYKAGDDANKMARDISRRIIAYMNMEA